jgi:NadR type nicotinamide-nucleotide adenylyltransferase
LVRFAAALCDRVTVLVEERPDEEVPVDVRAAWLEQAVGDPRVSVVALRGHHPQAPPDDPEGAKAFWNHWNRVLRTAVPGADAFVSTETYGRRLAQDLGVDWEPFEGSRIVPIHATEIRANPWDNWSWMIEPARANLVRRLVLIGPESTGKTQMAKHLAQLPEAPTLAVPEYAEDWIKRMAPVKMDERALHIFLHGQRASREACIPHANRWLVEDSHALTTAVWARYLGLSNADEAFRWAREDKPDHVLLVSPDGVPWVPDEHRYSAQHRQQFFDLFKAALDEWKFPYTVVHGSWEQRNEMAARVATDLIQTWRQQPLREWVPAQWRVVSPETLPHPAAPLPSAVPEPARTPRRRPSP